MRSRRSSRPSWSSSALTLLAAGSLSRTPVVLGVLLSRVVLSCTDMLCPPRSEGARCGTSAAEKHRRGGNPSCRAPLYGADGDFPVLLGHTRRLLAREAP